MNKWHEFLRLTFAYDPHAMADPRYIGLFAITIAFVILFPAWLNWKYAELGPGTRLAISLMFGMLLGALANAGYVGLL